MKPDARSKPKGRDVDTLGAETVSQADFATNQCIKVVFVLVRSRLEGHWATFRLQKGIIHGILNDGRCWASNEVAVEARHLREWQSCHHARFLLNGKKAAGSGL
jgi:hypothetical protein